MNAYLFLTQKNVQINDIPPRLMWNIDVNWNSPASGYCGETSILSAGLLYGQYVPMYLVRQLLFDYFNSLWGSDPKKPSSDLVNMWGNYFGISWNTPGAPGGDRGGARVPQAWFANRAQYYCQVLPQIWDASSGADNSNFTPINTVLQNLHLDYVHFQQAQDTRKYFVPWMKQHVVNGYPVVIGLQDFMPGSNDNDFDHIVIVIGWGSNNDLNENKFFGDDAIVFSDHGLVVGGQQPHGGSIPFYFKYTFDIPKRFPKSGGWLPDGGCQDPTNPAWSFIQNLGSKRNIAFNGKPINNAKAPTCNTYQLAESISRKKTLSNGNAGFAIKGLTDQLPQGVKVRIDTSHYYQIPCISAKQAQSGTKPLCKQQMTHTIQVSGLDSGKTYNLWLFEASSSADILQLPSTGFNAYGKKTKAQCQVINGQSNFNFSYTLPADVALFARCVLTSDD